MHKYLSLNLNAAEIITGIPYQFEKIERVETMINEMEKLIWNTGGIHGKFTNYNQYMTCFICREKITKEQFDKLPYWHIIAHQVCYQEKGGKRNCLLPRKVPKNDK